MRNPWKNALYAIKHNRRHLVYAVFHRLSWMIPNDRLYLKKYYKLCLGKSLNLDCPVTFNEKLQWLKLYDRKDIYTMMVDKAAVKQYVAERIGQEYVIPTLKVWKKPSDVDFDCLPNQFVLKTNHDGGCNGIVICKDSKVFDRRKALKEIFHSFYFRNPYLKAREWPYKNVRRCVFAEQYMEDKTTGELRDYKFFCFNGVVKALYVASERNTAADGVKFDYFDADFNHLELSQGHHKMSEKRIQKPLSFELMKGFAATLSKGIPFVRVDFYEVDGHPYFGEFTFFHLGGTSAFHPEKWDTIWGDWITLPNHEQ